MRGQICKPIDMLADDKPVYLAAAKQIGMG
jgi:hypothetical protein